ncbi:hypothetical protein [Flavihumibacter sp. UBA7668]|uniref:hypothetical protein n=1 Tax=Flavihumibacter sp. UBA7668 TaxID=1946542 RepID=UPI0025BA2D8C|nr:hypothetical protein [Flavihumibacter sp. UBA7668]
MITKRIIVITALLACFTTGYSQSSIPSSLSLESPEALTVILYLFLLLIVLGVLALKNKVIGLRHHFNSRSEGDQLNRLKKLADNLSSGQISRLQEYKKRNSNERINNE